MKLKVKFQYIIKYLKKIKEEMKKVQSYILVNIKIIIMRLKKKFYLLKNFKRNMMKLKNTFKMNVNFYQNIKDLEILKFYHFYLKMKI